ncbi:ATP/GTP-binding protein [Blastococcus saxobsidens]|uniref:ATP/GTP-binding protein n=1 Tax=Blastococcus saxobsidens TaxID=138336 RepID=A0A6L9W4C8_9ACTN|nr:ATP/GTP-binding protein [Blastococcus saxobsidens]
MVLLVAAMLAAPGGVGNAVAAPVACAKQDAQTGVCLVEATSPGQAADAAPVVDGVSSGGVQETGGEASPHNPCTYTVAQPQPAPTSHLWQGRSPADGAMYVQVCPRVDGSGLTTMLVFVPNGSAPPAGPPVDPRVLAEQAIASLVMRAPEIRMAPPPGSTSGLVGLPVWMWTERGEQFLGPTRQSVSAGGVTVAAVGQVSHVTWDMGDGTTVVCGAGTPYAPGVQGESPDCGHVYAQTSSRHVAGGGPWPITATSTWTVTWSGGGLSGTETLELSSSSELFVGELHVLNQDRSS